MLAAVYGLTFNCDPYTAVLDRDPQDLDILRALIDAAQEQMRDAKPMN